MRRWVAFLFHAPGLWLFYRQRLSPHLLRANLLAVAITAAAMALAWIYTGGWGALAAWAAGHVLWGAVLARRL